MVLLPGKTLSVFEIAQTFWSEPAGRLSRQLIAILNRLDRPKGSIEIIQLLAEKWKCVRSCEIARTVIVCCKPENRYLAFGPSRNIRTFQIWSKAHGGHVGVKPEALPSYVAR